MLYRDYLLSHEGKHTIEIPNLGFIVYMIVDGVVHVDILYVDPKFRRQGSGTLLMNKILETHKSENLKAVTCVVDTKLNSPTESLKAILSYGFEVVGVNDHEILLYKEL